MLTITIPGGGHDCDAGVQPVLTANDREWATQLRPRSPFAGDPEFRSSDLGAWTILNGSDHTIDANTTARSRLAILPTTVAGTVWFGSGRNGPFVYQVLNGDFDVYTHCATGPVDANPNNFWNAGLIVQSSINNGDWIECAWETRGGGRFRVVNTDNDFSSEYLSALHWSSGSIGAWIGAPGYLRIKRVGNDFSCYGWLSRTASWHLLKTFTRNDFSSDGRVGFAFYSGNGSTTSPVAVCDFIRTWPPYLTTNPTSSIIIDSGSADTVWDMSSFSVLSDPTGEHDPLWQYNFGSLAFKYGASNTTPPALNGSFLTEAQMHAQSNPIGRYFKLQVRYTSATGAEQATFAGATIDATIMSGSDFPDEDDVRAGVVFDSGAHTGTLLLPGASDVKQGVLYGAGGNEFTGTLVVDDGPAPDSEDILQRGADWLGQQLKQHASRNVEYRRGPVSVTLRATIGRSLFRIATSAGTKVQRTHRDYIFRVADLVAGGIAMNPQRGDRIVEQGGMVYEVLPVGDEPPFRFCDGGDGVSQGACVRVHTKRLATE